MRSLKLVFLVAAALGAMEARADCLPGATYCTATTCCNPGTNTVCAPWGSSYKCCTPDYPIYCDPGNACAKTQQQCDCYGQGKEPCGSVCMPKGSVCCGDTGNFCGANEECGCGGCMPKGSVCCGGGKTCPSGKECKCNGCVDPGSVCCNDGKTCPANQACDCGGCVPTGSICCGNLASCTGGNDCCGDKCIPQGTVCCGNGQYCPSGNLCATGSNQCTKPGQTRTTTCPAGYPVACSGNTFCCPTGTTCSGTNTCVVSAPTTSFNTPTTGSSRGSPSANTFASDAGGGPVGELKWGCAATGGDGALWLLVLLVPFLVRRRLSHLAVVAVLLLPVAARAQTTNSKDACSDGRAKGPDTAGHCCWPNQVWSGLRNTCVGIPGCPQGMRPDNETCVVLCPDGQAVGPDTGGHCCWPAQVWSSSRNVCVGIPTCPSGQRPEGEACVLACPAGQTAGPDTAGHCCWPNQVWSNSRGACMGIPDCPAGMSARGPECVAQAAVAPEPAPAPAPVPDPTPVTAAPQPVPAPTPMEGAPVPMDAAPVAVDSPSTAPVGPRTTLISRQEKEEEEFKRSMWVLGVDFLVDMSSGRFGLRLRTDIPLFRAHSPAQLGFGLGILPPSFMTPTNNTSWALPGEVTFGWRIALADARLHLVPRAGAAAHLMFGPLGLGFGLKILVGVGVRLNFNSSFGVNLSWDALIPAVGTGFVGLLGLGISV